MKKRRRKQPRGKITIRGGKEAIFVSDHPERYASSGMLRMMKRNAEKVDMTRNNMEVW